MRDKIDFVVTWVDGNDKKWQEEKTKTLKEYKNIDIDDREIRYRDYDILRYWFRGVEKYAPWVNKIYFITCGHLPKWLNTNNDKLVVVKHSDYMPKDALPTFNSNSIELLIHKIDGLEEQFVLFCDDLFIIDKVKERDFFRNGLPCNTMSLMPVIPLKKHDYNKVIFNNMSLINKHFDFNKWKKDNLFKILSFKQGKYLAKTLPFLLYDKFPGFGNYHIYVAYLKSTFKEVWEKENDILSKTVYSKFRNNVFNISHFVCNYWQFASGKYVQHSYKFGINLDINDKRVPEIIKKQKYKMICLADNDDIENFNEVQKLLKNSFDVILPDKSSFEK